MLNKTTTAHPIRLNNKNPKPENLYKDKTTVSATIAA
jgi:hypothetical protein